jgi:hypothetical protein
MVERATPTLEAANSDSLPKLLENESSVLLYGSMEEQKRLVSRVIGGSDLLVAIVNCEQLQEGHRQIAINGNIGPSTYENIVKLGFVPDLIVARCKTIEEAAALVEWTVIGSQLICMIAPRESDHWRWNSLDAFQLQVYCGDTDTFVLNRVTSSRQSPSSLPPSPLQRPSSQ